MVLVESPVEYLTYEGTSKEVLSFISIFLNKTTSWRFVEDHPAAEFPLTLKWTFLVNCKSGAINSAGILAPLEQIFLWMAFDHQLIEISALVYQCADDLTCYNVFFKYAS